MAVSGIGDRLEGIHTVAAALQAGRVTLLNIERGRADSAEVQQLIADAAGRGITVEMVDDVLPLASTSAPQGVVARARPIPTQTIREIVSASDRPAVIVLDHAEDPRNVGAIARSALAAGMTGMVVSSRRAAPLGATAFKAAVGAFEQVPVAVVGSIADAVSSLKDLGLWTVALDGSGDDSLFGLKILDDPVALILGAEGGGVSRLVAQRSDVVARVPMANDVESLNVSVAAALAMFEVARARGSLS